MDEKMKKLQTARENMYRFLSRLYMFEVDDVCFKNLEKAVFPQHCGNEDMAQGYKILSDFFQSHPISDALLDELAADYAGTFLAAGVAAGEAAFPYESVYLNSKHLVMQEAAAGADARYKADGLEIRRDMYHVPPDHVGLEMEYMAYLCANGKAAEEKQFFSQHLNNWVPFFSGEVIRLARSDFYKGLGWLTRGFMTLEQHYLNEI